MYGVLRVRGGGVGAKGVYKFGKCFKKTLVLVALRLDELGKWKKRGGKRDRGKGERGVWQREKGSLQTKSIMREREK